MWLICIKHALFNDNDNINNNHYHSIFKRVSILIKLANVFLCDLDHIKQLMFGAGRGRDGENHLHRRQTKEEGFSAGQKTGGVTAGF